MAARNDDMDVMDSEEDMDAAAGDAAEEDAMMERESGRTSAGARRMAGPRKATKRASASRPMRKGARKATTRSLKMSASPAKRAAGRRKKMATPRKRKATASRAKTSRKRR